VDVFGTQCTSLVSPATVNIDFMAAMHKFLVTDVRGAFAAFLFLPHCFYCLCILSVLGKFNQSINQSKIPRIIQLEASMQ